MYVVISYCVASKSVVVIDFKKNQSMVTRAKRGFCSPSARHAIAARGLFGCHASLTDSSDSLRVVSQSMETLPYQKKKGGRIETKETVGNKTQLCLTNSELIHKWIFVFIKLICILTKHKRK